MPVLKQLLLLFLFAGLTNSIYSQTIDTTHRDSVKLTEARLIKDNQQQQIDSLVKIQLENELKGAIGNKQKTLDLEKKLRAIYVSDSIRKIEQSAKISSLKMTAKGYPVILNRDTLFLVYTRIGSFNAKERALSVSGRIETLYDDPFFNADSILVAQNEEGYDLVYKKNMIILSVINLDGLWFGKSNEQLAKEYAARIGSIVSKEQREHSLSNWMKRIGLVVLIILFISLVIYLINIVFRRLAGLLSKHQSYYARGLKVGSVRIFTPQHLENAMLRLINVIRIAVIILVVYLSLPLLFSVFPETEAWAATLLNWILSPVKIALNAILHYLPKLFTVVVIYLIFKYAIRGIYYFFNEIRIENIKVSGFHADWALPTFNILRFILYAFMLILIFPFLPGSDSPAFQGVSVFLGILISLGSSSAITNIVAGLVITYMRPFKIGDRVKIGEVVGDVLEKTMLVTRIKTIKNEDVTVPNATVLSSSTVNYSTNTKPEKQGLIVHYTMTVGYDVPWKQVNELLMKAASNTEYILADPKPFVLQISLDDFYISYQINAYTREANKQAVIYSSLLQNIQDVFNAAGIEIMSPQYVTMREDKG